MLTVLSEFGKLSRYYNLDVVTGNTSPSKDVEGLWEEFETELVQKDLQMAPMYRNPALIEEIYGILIPMIVSKLERFARVLARQFTHGELGDEAKVHIGAIAPFMLLQDDDLGKTDYRATVLRS